MIYIFLNSLYFPCMDEHSFLREKLIDHVVNGLLDATVESSGLERGKFYAELAKRGATIAQKIKNAEHSLSVSSKLPFSNEIISEKASEVVNHTLLEGFLESAQNYDTSTVSATLSHSDVHAFLCSCCRKDKCTGFNNFIMSDTFDIPPVDYFQLQVVPGGNSLCSQFEKSSIDLESDILKMKSTVNETSGYFSGTQLSNSDFQMKSSSNIGVDSREDTEIGLPDVLVQKLCNSYDLTSSSDERYCDNFSWEGRMKQGIACHLYTSELTLDEIYMNVTDEDSQVFRSLYEVSNTVSEADLIRDVLDLLIGFPSQTFYFNQYLQRFQLRNGLHLAMCSHASTANFVAGFLESGTFFYKLENFSKYSATDGSVLSGFKQGVRTILELYTEYVVSLKAHKCTLHILRTHVSRTAQLINILAAVCNVHMEQQKDSELPTGLGLLSYLNKIIQCHFGAEIKLLMAVLLKFSYAPYFTYLNIWMKDGVCHDPHNEFQIITNPKFLNRKDDMYWKHAFVENKQNPAREVPVEFQKYSQDILLCGKSMRLLSICSQYNSISGNLEEIANQKLSFLFSYPAVIERARQCSKYLNIVIPQVHSSKHLTALGKFNVLPKESIQTLDISLNVPKDASTMQRSSSCLELTSHTETNDPPEIVCDRVGLLFNTKCDKTDEKLLETEPQNTGENIEAETEASGAKKGGLIESENLESEKITSESLISCEVKEGCPVSTEAFEKVDADITDCPIHGEAVECIETHQEKDESGTRTELTEEQQLSGVEMVDISLQEEKNDSASFIDNLLNILASECRDSKEDIQFYIQRVPLSTLIDHSIQPILRTRVIQMQAMVTDFLLNKHRLEDLLLCLKRVYFLQGAAFTQQLCEGLFTWTLRSKDIDEFADWYALNEILGQAVGFSCEADASFLSTASVHIVTIPEGDGIESLDFLKFFHFEFEVTWPLNVVVDHESISNYVSAFSELMRLEFLCWLLGKVWRTLYIEAQTLKLENSYQFRAISIARFEMEQFIRAVHSGMRDNVCGTPWDALLRRIRSGDTGIDALQCMHAHYLEKALARCLLTKDTCDLHQLLDMTLKDVHRFCTYALNCNWKSGPESPFFVTKNFQNLMSAAELFKSHKMKFHEYITKLVALRKSSRRHDPEFRLFLNEIRELLK